MSLRLVTCPETAHLELISYQEHPLGTLVDECSRFAPSCIPTCPRTCAERLDRRKRQREHPVAEAEDAAELPDLPDPCDVEEFNVGDDTNLGLAVSTDAVCCGRSLTEP